MRYFECVLLYAFVYVRFKLILNFQATWFQAAACCKKFGLNLANINNEGDLKGYFNLRKGRKDDWRIGWADIHGFSNYWRNLKGMYPQGNIYYPGSDNTAIMKGQCKKIGIDEKKGPPITRFYLHQFSCTHSLDEYIYCEDGI